MADDPKIVRFVRPIPADQIRRMPVCVLSPEVVAELRGGVPLMLEASDGSFQLDVRLRMEGDRIVGADTKLYEVKLPPDLPHPEALNPESEK
jgi:hypothetical protein